MKKLITVFVGIGNITKDDAEETIKSAIKSYRSIFPDESKFSILALPDRTSKGTRIQVDSLESISGIPQYVDIGFDETVVVTVSLPLGEYPNGKAKEYLDKQQTMFDGCLKADNVRYVVLPDRSGKGPRVQVDYI